MSLLSNDDIKRELGKNIFIYPLRMGNIRGSSINLSPSKLAWVLDSDSKKSAYHEEIDSVVIPPKKSVLILTEECLYVTNNIGGTYHSKVKVVSMGIGHIGTTLDPGWIGPSLITLHNHTHDEVKLRCDETFITIMLYWLCTPSSMAIAEHAGRPDICTPYMTQDEEKWLDEDWRKSSDALKHIMINSDEFKILTSELRDKSNKHWMSRVLKSRFFLVFLVVVVYFILGVLLTSKWARTEFDFSIKEVVISLLSSITTFLAVILITSKTEVRIEK